MAFTFNGIGTKFYGQRDFRTDGSYITTEWLVCLYVPLIPFRSFRVRYRGPVEPRWYLGLGYSDSYAVYEEHFPPHWKQVLYTYGYMAITTGWVYFVVSIAPSIFPALVPDALVPDALDTVYSNCVVFITCVIPIPAPWILRYYAKKTLRA